MGQSITLINSNGEKLGAYRAYPIGKPKGGLVVLQEIFGVNAHIKSVADRYAAQGYIAIAPAFFDHVAPDTELDYTPPSVEKGREIRGKVSNDQALADIAAAVAAASEGGKVGVVGYCWGGTLAYLSSLRVPGVSAAVGYYGNGIPSFLEEPPKAPAMLHYGERDNGIPIAQAEAVKAKFPEMPVFIYDAGHGFNCDSRGSYDEKSALLAQERTSKFFEDHLL